MKKFLTLIPVLTVIFFLTNCHTSKKATAAMPPAKTTYDVAIQPIIAASCSPCHIPSNGGNKKPLDTYASAKDEIDDILRRIQLDPGARGFMPRQHAKLSDSTIAVFTKWKADGLMEK